MISASNCSQIAQQAKRRDLCLCGEPRLGLLRHNGDPGWPKYELSRRVTKRFNTSQVVADPRSWERAQRESVRQLAVSVRSSCNGGGRSVKRLLQDRAGTEIEMAAGCRLTSARDLGRAGDPFFGCVQLGGGEHLHLTGDEPGQPLDGGRLLRSIIWWRTGDWLKAIRWSSRAGEALGWVLVALGLITFFARADFSGLWFALIGWFVIGAATAESQQATVRNQLGQLAIRDIMTPHPITASASMTVADLLSNDLIRHRHSTFP